MSRRSVQRADVDRDFPWKMPEPPKPLHDMSVAEVDEYLEASKRAIALARIEHAHAADIGRLSRRAEHARAWAAVSRLNPAQRRRARIFSCYCPQRCLLIEVFARRSETAESGEHLLIVSQTSRGPRHRLADDRGEVTTHWVAISCPHGEGAFTCNYPDHIRREGPAPRRRITDLLFVDGVSWTPSL